METYRIENLTFTYATSQNAWANSPPEQETSALKDINLTIERGSFVVLCGPSGCGKTTLLRQLKPSIAPHGIKSGAIYFDGTLLDELSARDAAAKIGFVLQSPDNQIVTDKVWHELAFGLESLGLNTPDIRLRVAEMASFFGIQTWFHKSVTELSGGQKQLLALASVMALQPSALILDEPTSQLDPIAAGEFLTTLAKINRELGVTVILTEHRLEEALPLASRTIVMDKGRIIADGAPCEVGLQLCEHKSSMFLAMPTPMRIWMAVTQDTYEAGSEFLSVGKKSGNCPVSSELSEVPITARDGANWLSQQPKLHGREAREACNHPSEFLPTAKTSSSDKTAFGFSINKQPQKPHISASSKPAILLDEVWFKYEKSLPDVVKDLSFTAQYGEITTILGGNGTGKTTTLSLIAGLYKPYRGTIHTDTKVYALPQNPQSLFVAKTVREDLLEILSDQRLREKEKTHKLDFIEKLCRLEGLLERHPYDLSGGEQQRAALGKVLLLQPKILLLDEPTKGLDAEYKQTFASILRKLADSGTCVLMVSHDVEFCAEHADRCCLFFDGNIVTENTPREFFSGNSFYTTTANRMARHVLPDAITVEDVVLALGSKMPPTPEVLDFDAKYEVSQSKEHNIKMPKSSSSHKCIRVSRSMLPNAREWLFLVFILLFVSTIGYSWMHWDNISAFIGGGREAIEVAGENAATYIGIFLTSIVSIFGVTLTAFWRRSGVVPVHQKRSLSKRTIVATTLILLTIPLTIYVGIQLFDDRRFYFISMLVILQTMLPFVMIFEGRKPQAREIIVIAVLCAIAVAGRSAFFMLPQFKPVVAIVVIAGVAFGGESGFLVGAMTGFVSNMFFGQGPWTPWQMFAFGIIGFLAGVMFRKGFLRRTPMPLAMFGGLATFIIYGGIMNPASVIMWQPNPTVEMFLIAYLQGIPFDLVHSAATVLFLIVLSRPMLEKLDRIKLKYGLVE